MEKENDQQKKLMKFYYQISTPYECFYPILSKRFLAAPEEFSETHHPLMFFTPETMEVWSSTALCFSCNLGEVGNPGETQGFCLNILEDLMKKMCLFLEWRIYIVK